MFWLLNQYLWRTSIALCKNFKIIVDVYQRKFIWFFPLIGVIFGIENKKKKGMYWYITRFVIKRSSNKTNSITTKEIIMLKDRRHILLKDNQYSNTLVEPIEITSLESLGISIM